MTPKYTEIHSELPERLLSAAGADVGTLAAINLRQLLGLLK
jgi:hypothetical protein